jgi:hypothetical protein
MSFTVSRRTTRTLPTLAGVARALAAEMPGLLRARVARGLDIFDRAFASYDPDYARLTDPGVDLDGGQPGGLLSTLVVRVRIEQGRAIITIAPDAAHMAVGTYLHRGTPKMNARPWLGLSPRDLVVLRQRVSGRA